MPSTESTPDLSLRMSFGWSPVIGNAPKTSCKRHSSVPGRTPASSIERPDRYAPGWTVARRIVIDGHRSRQARPQEVDPSPLEVIPAEDEIDKALWLMTLSDALDDLTPAHREVLVETYFKGRTVNEAAETLGIPSGTVRSRVFYALRSMKLALEERGVTA